MKVHLIKIQTIEDYVVQNAGSKISFAIWIQVVKNADWNIPIDIKNTFGAADFLGRSCNRIVFDIGGNNYRLICKYQFCENSVKLYVKWIGTHAEYDKLCNKELQYTVNNY